MPWLQGETMEADLAFASMAEGSASEGSVKTRFFMPVLEKSSYEKPLHTLTDARDVTFGDKVFAQFVGTKRA